MDTFTKWLIILLLSANTGMLVTITDRMIEWATKEYQSAYEQGAKDMYKHIQSQGE